MNASAATPKLCPTCGNRSSADALFCPIDGTPLVAGSRVPAGGTSVGSDPYLGREILGHIEIRHLVGIGSMGRVYRAFQGGIDRDVAIKILHRELSTNPQVVGRFHREAKVASRLQHPNVVHVHLTGQLPDGEMYIAMEYLDGLSLQSAMAAAGGVLPLQRALHVALQLCDAVGEAHAQGVVHRDIKPENVMLVRRGDDPDFVKVLDFGIARLSWGDQSMATAAGLIFGTARYISPEGAQGGTVGPASDVYSVATLVYQMLAGRTPFDGDQAVAILVQQIHDPPLPLPKVPRAADVPAPIADVVMRNLAKTPAERDPDARAFGRALLEAAKESGFAPEHIVSRPMLLGARVSGPSAPPTEVSSRRSVTAYETPDTAVSEHGEERTPQRTEISDEPSLPPIEPPVVAVSKVHPEAPSANGAGGPRLTGASAPTTKWTPPIGFEARLRIGTGAPSPAAVVDRTMDDRDDGGQPESVRAIALAVPARAAHAPAGRQPVAPTLAPEAEPPPHVSAPPPPASQASPAQYPARPVPPAPAFEPVAASRPISRPSSVDATMSDREPAGHGRRPHLRAAALVLGFFLVGVGGATFVVHHFGLLSPSARVPHDPPSSRETAWRDPTPPEATAQPKVVATEAVPPLATASPGKGGDVSGAGRPGASAASVLRVAVDVSPAHPRPGQPVDLVARIVGAKRVEGGAFQISGPGIPGTEISALADEAGICRATFTFMDTGRFDVVFAGKADGASVRGARSVQTGPASLPPPSTTTTQPRTDPAPPSSGPGKWL